MPKKKVISMLEFLRTGSFGGIQLGSSIEKLFQELGEPLYSYTYEHGSETSFYNDVCFFTNLEQKIIWGISINDFQTRALHKSYICENEKFVVNPWKFKSKFSIKFMRDIFETTNLSSEIHLSEPCEGYTTIRLASGVELQYGNESIYINEKVYFAHPEKTVCRGIRKIAIHLSSTYQELMSPELGSVSKLLKPQIFASKLTTKIRIARPTNQLKEVMRFYRDGLGFSILASFENHDGFDGVMLGLEGAIYHLEFTHHQGHVVPDAPTQDNLLVFYFPVKQEWLEAVGQMQKAGFEPVKSYNPYWDVRGKTFQDPDGYRVVLQNAEWSV